MESIEILPELVIITLGASFACNVSCVLLSTIFYVHLAFVPTETKRTKDGKRIAGVTEFVEGMGAWDFHSPDAFLVFGIVFLLLVVLIRVSESNEHPDDGKLMMVAHVCTLCWTSLQLRRIYLVMFRDNVLEKDKTDFKEMGEALVQKARDLSVNGVQSSVSTVTVVKKMTQDFATGTAKSLSTVVTSTTCGWRSSMSTDEGKKPKHYLKKFDKLQGLRQGLSLDFENPIHDNARCITYA
jgi:hypothetical protein